MFRIFDWAGNQMNYGTFKTFEDAWEYLLERFETDDELGEFYVEKIERTTSLDDTNKGTKPFQKPELSPIEQRLKEIRTGLYKIEQLRKELNKKGK